MAQTFKPDNAAARAMVRALKAHTYKVREYASSTAVLPARASSTAVLPARASLGARLSVTGLSDFANLAGNLHGLIKIEITGLVLVTHQLEHAILGFDLDIARGQRPDG